MKRVGALAAVAALIASAVSAAQEPLGRQRVEVVIPKGALPAGPAVAEEKTSEDEGIRGMSLEWPRQRIRFQMPDGPMTLTFSRGILQRQRNLTVEVRSDSGAIWEARADPAERPAAIKAKLFVGTADELAALSRATHVALPDQAEELVNGFELRAPGPDADAICHDLRSPSTVVFAEATPSIGAALRRCAARGVEVLAIGSAGLAAPDLGPGHGVLWGAGRYGWAPDLDRLAADALRDLSRGLSAQSLGETAGTSDSQWTLLSARPHGETEVREALPVDSKGILWILLAYVLALALVGAWGVSRPRRSMLLWLAFPGTAAVAAGSLALVGAAIDHQESNLKVDLVEVVAPGGDGVAAVSLLAYGRQAEALEISLPWTAGTLNHFRLGRGLGTPFAASFVRSAYLEDNVAGTLTFEHLQIARRSSADIHLTQSVGRLAPYLSSKDGGLFVVNPTERELKHVVLILDGKRATLAAIPPGATQAIQLGDTSQGDPFATWLGAIDTWSPEQHLPPHTYLLAAEDDPGAVVTTRPAIATRSRRTTVTIGPIGTYAIVAAADVDGGRAP